MQGDQSFRHLWVCQACEHAVLHRLAIQERAQDHNDHDFEQAIDRMLSAALLCKRLTEQCVENVSASSSRNGMTRWQAEPVQWG